MNSQNNFLLPYSSDSPKPGDSQFPQKPAHSPSHLEPGTYFNFSVRYKKLISCIKNFLYMKKKLVTTLQIKNQNSQERRSLL